LFDLDGVVYRREMALPGATELVPTLQELGIRHAFVTNFAAGPGDIVARLNRMSVPATPDDVVTSASAAAVHLQKVASAGSAVYVIGEPGLHEVIRQAGFVEEAEHPAYVVMGLDLHITYERLATACVALRAGAGFIATNLDPIYPAENAIWPGAGALAAVLITATGVQPTVIGKPQPTLLHVALERLGASPDHAAMVGDQVASDIRAGKAAGLTTILVSEDEPVPDPATPIPDLRVRNLQELLELLRQART
jgi:4-nitrophenyl phosphatase